jgi:bacterioferritin
MLTGDCSHLEARMKGDKKVIQYLNKVLINELTSINQYFLHAKMFKNWGFKKLADHTHHESIDEMKHADRLIERTLFLEGLPNLQDLNKLMVGENVPEALACDLKLERAAHPVLKAAIAHCETVGDYISRELFEDILESEEEHIDFLETQLSLVKDLGVELYSQHHIGKLGEGDKD